MGGCATKPKVLKDDDPSDAPAPAPLISPRAPPLKEEDTVVKEAVVENDANDPKEGSVVDHDSATKNSSLGNLFKENQEVKDSGGAETVKVPDVSEVTTKEVEKTIPEDSSLEKAEEKKIEEEEGAKGKKTAATEEEEEEEVVGEIAEKKPDEVNVVMPEDTNLDHIKPRVANPDEKKPAETQQQQEQEGEGEKDKKETDESLKHAIVHRPPAAAADQEKFATPKEKPEETYATTAKEEKKTEAEQIQGDEQQTLKK